MKCNLGVWQVQPRVSRGASRAHGGSKDRTSPRGWRLARPVGFAHQACGGFQKAFGPEAVEEAVAGCVSKPRRGEKDAGGSSLSLRGAIFALSNDRGLAPRRRAIVRAKSPLVPTKPLARRRGVLGLLSRPNNGSTTTTPASRGLCEKSPNLAAELPLPLGAARRRWR